MGRNSRRQLRDQAERLSAQPLDFSDPAWEVVPPDAPRPQTVFSTRMPPEWTDEIMSEMTRRGLANPSQLIKALVREGLDRALQEEPLDPASAELVAHLDAVRRGIIAHQRRAA